MRKLEKDRKQILDDYATDKIDHEDYATKCLNLDIETSKLKLKRTETLKKIPILHKQETIDVSVRIFCETVKARFSKCKDFKTKRRFVLDFLEEVLYDNGKVVIKGLIPLHVVEKRDSEENGKIEFRIKG